MRVWVAIAVSLISLLPVAGEAQLPPRPRGPHPIPQRDHPLPPIARKMTEALTHLRYSGTREVLLHMNDRVQRNIERLIVDGRRSRTHYLPGSTMAGHIIVEDKGHRLHYDPSTKEIKVLPPRQPETQRRLMNLLRMVQTGQARVRIEDGGIIAKHPTQKMIVFNPEGAIIQSFWIDEKTGLPLKRQIFEPGGRIGASYEFSEIDYRPEIKPEDFVLSPKGAKTLSVEDQLKVASDKIGFEPYRLTAAGFQLIDVRSFSAENRQVLVCLYAGARGRVSFFQFKGRVNPQRMRRLAGQRHSSYAWFEGDVSCVLVGDLTRPELQQLAQTAKR